MPQKLLYGAQVGAVCQQIGRERVPQIVRRGRRRYLGSVAVFFEDIFYAVFREFAEVTVDEQIVVVGAQFFAYGQPFAQIVQSLGAGQVQQPFLAAFAVYQYYARAHIEIVQSYGCGFADTYASRRDQIQKSKIAGYLESSEFACGAGFQPVQIREEFAHIVQGNGLGQGALEFDLHVQIVHGIIFSVMLVDVCEVLRQRSCVPLDCRGFVPRLVEHGQVLAQPQSGIVFESREISEIGTVRFYGLVAQVFLNSAVQYEFRYFFFISKHFYPLFQDFLDYNTVTYFYGHSSKSGISKRIFITYACHVPKNGHKMSYNVLENQQKRGLL